MIELFYFCLDLSPPLLSLYLSQNPDVGTVQCPGVPRGTHKRLTAKLNVPGTNKEE